MDALAFILAAIALFIAHGKQKQINLLSLRLRKLETATPPAAVQVPVRDDGIMVAPVASPIGATSDDAAESEVAGVPVAEAARVVADGWAAGESGAAGATAPKPKPPRQAFDLERAVGVHLPIWGGALMLLIAGFFLARMAADNGFFTPTLGVIACGVGALMMLAAAFAVRWLKIANHGQIAAALASAAIGTLYATSFLSSAAFGLTSLFTGFVLSSGTAGLALGIALLFGRPVLVVGLLGGYLAPFFLFADAPQEGVFHLYLGALLVAGTAACVRQGWWAPMTPMLLLHFAWLAAFLLLGAPYSAPAVTTLVALVATPIAVFLLSERRTELQQGTPSATSLATALAVLLVVFGAELTDFGALYLIGFAVLVVATSGMTMMARSETVRPTYIAVAGWLCLIALWRDPVGMDRLLISIVVAVAIAVPLAVGLLKGRNAMALAVTLCLVVSATFVSTMIDLDGWAGVRDLPFVWAALALVFAAAGVFAAVIFGRAAPTETGDRVRGVFSASASAFVSIAIVAVVDPSYFALAAALQVLGLSLVFRRYPSPHLLTVAGLYVAIYVALLVLSVPASWGLTGLARAAAYIPAVAPWDVPVVAMLLPALAFLAAGTILRDTKGRLALALDAGGVLLSAFAASCLILPELGSVLFVDALIWSSLWGNTILLIGAVAMLAGMRLSRPGLHGAGLVLLCGMVAGIAILVAQHAYRFWPEWNVPGLPLLNISLTGLVVPGAFAFGTAWMLRAGGRPYEPLRWGFAVAGGFLVFTGMLVDIRHLFHPELLQGPSGEIERYTYSGGMLLMAFTALILGTRLDSQPLRYGSLVIMLATVAKLFLFDIGGLEGLWRVASFVAMGVALLGTSWFYGRHVFGRGKGDAEPATPLP